MKAKLATAARLLFGLIFTVFGFNGFFHFIPLPELTPQAGAMMGALANTGYFFPLLKVTEIVCGLLLLSRFYVPLALIVLAPVVVHIAAFHIVLDPGGLPLAGLLVALEAFLGCAYCSSFKGVLSVKADTFQCGGS
jgi:putative oxidoreductase